MSKPQSLLNEPSQESPPTIQINHDSLQSHSLPLGVSCDTNIGHTPISSQNCNQTQLTQPPFPQSLINPHVASMIHAQAPLSPQSENQAQPPSHPSQKVKEALRKMGRNKVVGPDEIPSEAWKCLGGQRVRWLTLLFNKTFLRAKMLEEWRRSKVIPIYKNMGNAQTCSNYRGIKLLSHTMKLWERVIERRLRRETKVSENQFGFMSGWSLMEAIHIIRSLMEKYRERQKDLHLAFLDLEKAYDSVPRELILKTLRDKGTSVKYIKFIQDTYDRERTYVRTPISGYDIVLVSDTPEGLNGRLEQWREGLTGQQREDKIPVMRLQHEREQLNESFRYLGSEIHKSDRIKDDVTHRIQAGWLKWRAAMGVLCDKNVPLKLKGKFYRVAIRPAMLYGSECWPLTKVQANRMEVAEMRMLRWNLWRPQSAPVRRVDSITVKGMRRSRIRAKRVRSKLEKQGIKGPSPSFMHGNTPEIKSICLRHAAVDGGDGVISHDWATKVFPHFYKGNDNSMPNNTVKGDQPTMLILAGKTFAYSAGNIHFLCITDPELVKEVSLHTSLDLGKPSYLSKDRGPMFGQGILSSNGPYWSHQRKIIAPHLYPDKVKDMVTLMANATSTVLHSWESKIKQTGDFADIRIDNDLRSVSADIISRACFGSNYSQGEMIFSKLRALQGVMSKASIGVPVLRYVPSKNNRETWKLENDINSRIVQVVKSSDEGTSRKDLLQTIIKAAKKDGGEANKWIHIDPRKFIVDNCKSLYFAGYETTATSVSWCLMLLAKYPEWQSRCRTEVLDICRDKLPDMTMLQSMKTLTMVIQEALRLYPPVAFTVREALKDIKFRNILIPKGINVQTVIPMLHQHPELWGPDVYEFKPERFAEGTKGACKIPQAYMPFGMGPRICAGQHFAMTELKVILALVLSRFSFSLSPTYRHSPTFSLDFQIIVSPLSLDQALDQISTQDCNTPDFHCIKEFKGLGGILENKLTKFDSDNVKSF
ncbi:cytochrome P450 714C2-like protein [Tanacetum coccineum]